MQQFCEPGTEHGRTCRTRTTGLDCGLKWDINNNKARDLLCLPLGLAPLPAGRRGGISRPWEVGFQAKMMIFPRGIFHGFLQVLPNHSRLAR
jgi:hypothetical protein